MQYNFYRRNNTTGDLKMLGSQNANTKLDAIKKFSRRGYGLKKGNYLVIPSKSYSSMGVRIDKANKDGVYMRNSSTNKLIKIN